MSGTAAAFGCLTPRCLGIEHQDLPIIYLFNEPVLMAMRHNLDGFTIIPDGLMRLEDWRLANRPGVHRGLRRHAVRFDRC